MNKVFLWGGLRPAAGGAEFVEIEALTIRELLRKLAERHPKLETLIDSEIAVSINGTIYQDDWSKKIPKDAEIYLLPRIEGG